MPETQIIINADDFGLSDNVNRAIVSAFENGLISDTTMMANGSAFDEAVTLAKENGFADKVGIHFNLTEGAPLTEDIRNCPAFCENGVFHNHINRLKPLNSVEKASVFKELSAQAAKIKAAGLKIDHADSHHHIHTAIFIAPIVFKVCKEFGIEKIRIHRNTGSIPAYKKVIKNLYNKNLRKKGFITTGYFGSLDDIGEVLPENLEIMVHPDFDKDGALIDRREVIDGIPAGIPLYSIPDKYNITLKSYGDL
ncbi:MAG: ChbG/HpnK family deacetylase [Clostridia bacterium]|nr:ChbG/HpnK family deacetylase [Clostridia bacterium]